MESSVGRTIPRDQLRRNVLILAWPVCIEMILQMMLGIVDTAMVGKHGPAAIAAVGFGNTILTFVISVFAAITVGTTALVARHIGAGEQEDAAVVARQSILLSLGLSALITALGLFFAREGIRGMLVLQKDMDDAVISQGTAFIRLVSLTMIPGLVMQTVNAILRGAGDTRTPMSVTVLVNFINIALNVLLVNGIGEFSLGPVVVPAIPALGVVGSGIATAAARGVGGIVALRVLFSVRSRVTMSLSDDFRINMPEIKRVMNVGIPAAAEQLVMRGGMLLFGVVIGGLGTVAFAAHNIALTVESISFMPGFAFSIAATTLVGQALGAKDPELAMESGFMATKISAAVMSVMGIVFYVLAKPMVLFFSNDPEVVSLAVMALRIVAVSQPVLAVVMCLAGSLRGAGDTRWVMYITAISYWGVRLTLSYLLAITLGFGLMGAWISMTIELFVRGALSFWRYNSGRWKEIKV